MTWVFLKGGNFYKLRKEKKKEKLEKEFIKVSMRELKEKGRAGIYLKQSLLV